MLKQARVDQQEWLKVPTKQGEMQVCVSLSNNMAWL